MTGGNLYFPQYRPGSAKVVAPGSFALAGMAGGLAGMSRSGVPVPVTLGLLVMLVIAFALLVVAFKRSATITGPDHIVVQNAFGTKRTAWAEIQAIEVQSNPAALLETNKPREYVVVYDSSGRVVQLPHVDAKSVPALHDEVRTLRGLWEQLRGADWTPMPEVAAKVDRSRRRTDRVSAWLVGFVAAMGALVVTMVVLLALVVAGAMDGLSGPAAAILSPKLFIVVPVVVFVVTVTVSLARRRRRSDPRG